MLQVDLYACSSLPHCGDCTGARVAYCFGASRPVICRMPPQWNEFVGKLGTVVVMAATSRT